MVQHMVLRWIGIEIARKPPRTVSRPLRAAREADSMVMAASLRKAWAWRRRLGLVLRVQSGFSLMESVAAIAIIGVSVVGSVLLLDLVVKTSSHTEESQGLTQILRAQAETIQNQPYNDDPSLYPLLDGIPPNVSVTFTASDPGTRYTFREPNGASLGQVIQQIVVTAKRDQESESVTLYKIKTP